MIGIKSTNMSLPNSCDECRISKYSDPKNLYCPFINDTLPLEPAMHMRHKDCPLIELNADTLEDIHTDADYIQIDVCDDRDNILDYDTLDIKSIKSVDGLIDEIKKMKKTSGVTGQGVWNECLHYVIETIKEYCEGGLNE